MRVDTWKETTLGSNQYIPATLFPTKYGSADFQVYKNELIASDASNVGTAGFNNIHDDDDVVILNQSGASQNGIGAVQGHGLPAGVNFLSAGEAQDAISTEFNEGGGSNWNLNTVYFIEIEADDTSVSNLETFTAATNELGKDNSLDIVITGDGNDDVYAAGNNDNSYLIGAATWTLTAEAKLHNAKVALAVAQVALVTVTTGLTTAQDAFDVQRELFEDGVASLEGFDADKTATSGLETSAKTAVSEAWTDLGADITAPTVAGTLPTSSTLMGDHYNALLAKLNAEAAVVTAGTNVTNLENCDVVCLQLAIDAAQHAITLIQPKLDVALEILAEMTLEYDEIMVTYRGVNLDADLQAQYNRLMHDAQLKANQMYVVENQIDHIEYVLGYLGANPYDINGNFVQFDNLEGLASKAQTYYVDHISGTTGTIVALGTAEDALEAAHATGQANDALHAFYVEKSAMLSQQIENALAQAAVYLALMQAALQS